MRRNVSPLWRAACIGFATATVVLMGVAFTMQSTFDESLQAFRDGDLAQQIAEKIGPRFVDTLLSPSADRVNFTPVADNPGKSGAVLLIDRETNLAFLVCKDLPKIDGQYALVVTDAEGKSIKTIARFETAGELNGRPIDGGVAPGMQLAIFAENSPRDAKPVLVSL